MLVSLSYYVRCRHFGLVWDQELCRNIMSHPAGIVDISKDDWIDLDEASIFTEKANCKQGKAYIAV